MKNLYNCIVLCALLLSACTPKDMPLPMAPEPNPDYFLINKSGVISPYSVTSEKIDTQYFYNQDGLLVRAYGTFGNERIDYYYNSDGQLSSKHTLDVSSSTYDIAECKEKILYFYNGNILLKDECYSKNRDGYLILNNYAKYKYNQGVLNLIQRFNPDSTLATEIVYSLEQNRIKKKDTYLYGIAGKVLSSEETYSYDNTGRLEEIECIEGANKTTHRYVYDENNLIVKESCYFITSSYSERVDYTYIYKHRSEMKWETDFPTSCAHEKKTYTELKQEEIEKIEDYITNQGINVINQLPNNGIWGANDYYYFNPDNCFSGLYYHLVNPGDTTENPINLLDKSTSIRIKQYSLTNDEGGWYKSNYDDIVQKYGIGVSYAINLMKYKNSECIIICPSCYGSISQQYSVCTYKYQIQIL